MKADPKTLKDCHVNILKTVRTLCWSVLGLSILLIICTLWLTFAIYQFVEFHHSGVGYGPSLGSQKQEERK